MDTSFILPIISLDSYLKDPSSLPAQSEATKAVEALITFGACLVKDPRVSESANDKFLDLLEDYFAQPEELLQKDTRPQWFYQAGTTLENIEKPKCHSDSSCQAIIASLEPSERPLDLTGGNADPKCRFFHRMGKIPPTTSFPSLEMTNVTPEAFKETWEKDMEEWGKQIKTAIDGITEMIGVGLGVGAETLLKAAEFGPHLLAPTATNLDKYGGVGEIFAGFHTDLNFLTIHGRSRYSGLNIWARNTGKRITVSLPPGILLVQAGKQIEHLTGGLILAGYHEVICTEKTIATIKSRKISHPTRPSIRISSTFFHHLSSDYAMNPNEFRKGFKSEWKDILEKNREEQKEEGEGKYKVMKVGTLVQEELRHISLMS